MQLGIAPDSGTPYPGYLIQTDDGANVLVDTGFPPGIVELSRAPDFRGPRVTKEDLIVNQLARLGVKPDDVRYVVATHYDGDHAGSLDSFPNAEIVVQRAHDEAARSGLERFARIRGHWDSPNVHLRRVDGDVELLPGIELIESGGHVPGHQSVLVRLPETGPVLLAIDAISHALGDETPETRTAAPHDMDPIGLRASTRKLVDLAGREGVTLIVYGHDGQQWAKLKKAPEFYS